MIGELISIISLNMTLSLVQDYGVIAGTLTITGATQTTPIQISIPNHGFPSGRVIHGVVTGVLGTVEANGLWVLTVVDQNTFSLATFTAQGLPVQSVGVNAYISGGQVQYAFPDGSILLGRRNPQLATSVASPRIVFIPTDGKAWSFESYGGAGPDLQPASVPNVRGSAQQQSMTLQPQLATEYTTFEVTVHGSGPNYGNPLSPEFYDFNATQALVFVLYAVLFDASGPARAKVLHESWPSQKDDAGAMTQRGQMWKGVIEFQQPVTRVPKEFVPIGTYLQEVVQPLNGLVPGDQTTIDVHQDDGP
jgi:hypothetical protein